MKLKIKRARAVGDHLASRQGRRLIEERCVVRLEKTPDPFYGFLIPLS